jgi:hypothetical protein
MIVIAGIERDAVERAGSRHPAQHIERAIAVERRDLDRDDIVDLGEAPPEIRSENDAADRGLKIEADQRNFARYRPAMRDDLVFGRRFHRRQTEQAGMIADAARRPGFADSLLRRAAKTSDHHERPLGPACCGLSREFQHRPIHLDIADRKLRGVHADRKPAGAGVNVITRQRALMFFVELAVGVERERMGGQHRAFVNQPPHLGFHLAMMHGDPYPYSGPATANGNSDGLAVVRPKRMR